MRARMLIAAAAVVLAACGGGSGGYDAHTQGYLDVLKESNVHYDSDAEAIAAGKKACDRMRGGKTGLEVSEEMNVGDDFTSGAIVVGAAVSAFCPDQKPNVAPK